MAARKKKREEPLVCEADLERIAARKAWVAEQDRRDALPRIEVHSIVEEDGVRYRRIEIVPCELMPGCLKEVL